MKLAVMVSGKGTNLQAIIDAIKQGYLTGTEISFVICNKPEALAVQRAETSHIPVILVNKKEMVAVLRPIFSQVDLVVLAGFLLIIPDELLGIKPIINVHPALLPFFGGKGMYGERVAEETIRSGMKVAGATVHFVTGDIDGGPIIMQKSLEVRDDDTPEILLERMHPIEHQILVESIKLLKEKKYEIRGKRAVFS